MKIPKYLSAGQKIRGQNVYKSNLGFFQTIPKVIIISRYKKIKYIQGIQEVVKCFYLVITFIKKVAQLKKENRFSVS